MRSNDVLIIPRPNIPFSYGFGLIMGAISGSGIFFSIRSMIKYDLSWDFGGSIFIIIFVFCLRLIFLHKILEFHKESCSLTIYWGVGFPFIGWFIKLPWIWRDYSEDQIASLKVARGLRIDGSTDAEGYLVYEIKAKIAREWVDLLESTKMDRSLDVSTAIAEFLGVPVDKTKLY
jgi:hypothetical protein